MPPVSVPHQKVVNTKWKFQVTATCFYRLRKLSNLGPFAHCTTKSGQTVESPVIAGKGNVIVFFEGYSWDGASGPAVDTLNTRRASLVHDGLYQAIRLGQLSRSEKGAADAEMMQILKDDGMGWPRRLLWQIGRPFMKPGRKEVYQPCPNPQPVPSPGAVQI